MEYYKPKGEKLLLGEMLTAPPFTVFGELKGKVDLLHVDPPDKWWGCFEQDGDPGEFCFDGVVGSTALAMGIKWMEGHLGPVAINASDEDAPKDFDDVHAAMAALNRGYTLVKLHDTIISQHYRFYVVDTREPLRLLFNVSDNHDACTYAVYAYVELTEEDIAGLLLRHDSLISLKEKFDDLFYIEFSDYTPELYEGSLDDALEEDLADHRYAVVTKKPDFEALKMRPVPKDVSRLCMTDDSLHWETYLKHTSFSLETQSINYEELGKLWHSHQKSTTSSSTTPSTHSSDCSSCDTGPRVTEPTAEG